MSDLHREDILNLAELKADFRMLYGINKAMGVRVKDVQEANGHSHGYLARMLSRDRYPWDWKWSTMVNLSEAVWRGVEVRVSGIELVQTPLYELGLKNLTFMGVGLLESMKATREAMGVTGVAMSERLGLGEKSAWKLEESDNPYLTTPMRYIRALGGSVSYRIEDK